MAANDSRMTAQWSDTRACFVVMGVFVLVLLLLGVI